MGILTEDRSPVYRPELDDYEQEWAEWEEAVEDRYSQPPFPQEEADEVVLEKVTLSGTLYWDLYDWLLYLDPHSQGEGHGLALEAFETAREIHYRRESAGGGGKCVYRITIDGRALAWLRRHRGELFSRFGESESRLRYLRALLR